MMNNQLSLLPKPSLNQTSMESLSQILDKSLRSLSGKRVFFRSDYSKETIPLQKMELSPKAIPFEVMSFSKNPRDRNIVSIDSSCALIGETEDGTIFAGRVAMVSTSRQKSMTHYRAGPFIYYMNQQTLADEFGSKLPRRAARAILSDTSLAERLVRIRLERLAQLRAARTEVDSLILVDGSIKSSILETPELSLRELEQESVRNMNQIVGFSKASSLRFVSNAGNLLQASGLTKVFFDITDELRLFMQNLESRILVTRFCQGSQVFRIDMSRANTEEDSQILADLAHNDLFFRGYPESLRLAHHLSVFDSFMVSSIRSYLSKKFRLVRIASDDLRATILGKLV